MLGLFVVSFGDSEATVFRGVIRAEDSGQAVLMAAEAYAKEQAADAVGGFDWTCYPLIETGQPGLLDYDHAAMTEGSFPVPDWMED